jgi:hypothetical protein
MNTLLDTVKNLLPPPLGDFVSYAVVGLGVVIVLWIAWRLFGGRKRSTAAPVRSLKIDLAMLVDTGPPNGFPLVEFYNVPVRVAAVVFAPAGRVRELPPDSQLLGALDGVAPGLDKVAALHRPIIRRWASQVSVRGFAHLFFSNVQLPGTAGKGTPWTSVAGVFKLQGLPLMVGLVLRADRPNSFGQTVIESEEQWINCLRVKWS